MSQDKQRPQLPISKRLLQAVTFPILKGPAVGLRWSLASGGKIARVLLGTYETEQTLAMARALQPGDVFLDLGAHHGYCTLMASRRVGANGKVLAFEPNPRNSFFLKKHVRINRLGNVEVVESAVGAENGSVRFAQGSGSGTGHIGDNGEISVSITRLDDELARRDLAPTHIKIDVEGAEVDVLAGAEQTLTDHRPVIFLSTHGAAVHADCCRILASLDYQLTPIHGVDLETATEIHCIPRERVQARAA